MPFVYLGCQATERAADGDARTQRKVYDSRAESLHSNSRRLRWTVYWSTLSACRLPG